MKGTIVAALEYLGLFLLLVVPKGDWRLSIALMAVGGIVLASRKLRR